MAFEIILTRVSALLCAFSVSPSALSSIISASISGRAASSRSINSLLHSSFIAVSSSIELSVMAFLGKTQQKLKPQPQGLLGGAR